MSAPKPTNQLDFEGAVKLTRDVGVVPLDPLQRLSPNCETGCDHIHSGFFDRSQGLRASNGCLVLRWRNLC